MPADLRTTERENTGTGRPGLPMLPLQDPCLLRFPTSVMTFSCAVIIHSVHGVLWDLLLPCSWNHLLQLISCPEFIPHPCHCTDSMALMVHPSCLLLSLFSPVVVPFAPRLSLFQVQAYYHVPASQRSANTAFPIHSTLIAWIQAFICHLNELLWVSQKGLDSLAFLQNLVSRIN